jgi:hypothetical protein
MKSNNFFFYRDAGTTLSQLNNNGMLRGKANLFFFQFKLLTYQYISCTDNKSPLNLQPLKQISLFNMGKK